MEQLICENITKNYKSKDALDSVNLTLEKGKIYGLIGRNGAGKTTLLSILSAQNPPSEGSVVLETEEGRLSVWENEKALSHICFSSICSFFLRFHALAKRKQLPALPASAGFRRCLSFLFLCFCFLCGICIGT